MSELDDLRKLVALSCRIIGRHHLTREPNGHVSARIPNSELILIKARGAGESALSDVKKGDVIVADMAGKLVQGREGLASPAEVFIHTQVYKSRPEVNSVIHIHPASVVAFTIAEKPLQPIIGAYNPVALRLILEGLPLYPRSVLINSPQRGDELVGAMGLANACLMRGHGITTTGATVESATLTALHLHELAELQYRSELLGGAKPIPPEDIEEFRAMNASATGRDGVTRATSSEWRYYAKLYG
jgi:ribulose-5-phosphate 4-epimerase/fuculose-1-phosphate aldolase